MWRHEIYGFFVTERELEAALKLVVDGDPEHFRRIFRDAIDRGRAYERHGDIHMDSFEDASGL